MSDSATLDNSLPRLENNPVLSTSGPNFQPANQSQCRLRRIQSSPRPIPPPPPPQPTIPCQAAIHIKPDSPPSATDNIATTTAFADLESDSDTSPLPSRSPPPIIAPPSPHPSYPFPPPGLSKTSPITPALSPTLPQSTKDMITPELEASSCTPRELELKFDQHTAPGTLFATHPSEPDGSIWTAFQMESFLGNYCHTGGKSTSPSIHNHEDGVGCHLRPASVTPFPSPRPPTLSPLHWNRLVKDPVPVDDTALTTLNTPTAHTTSPPQPLLIPSSPLPLFSSPPIPPSVQSAHLPHSATPPQVNPLMAQRQQQQAFMTSWNRVRQGNRYAPVMPSFFNPARSDAPACAWTFLRDPTCGGAVNERASARRGKDSVFEKPLIKLPLTRCRSICDRVRRDQQNLLGWGIHAWIAPMKHCRYCANDDLLKGFLAYRAFEAERIEDELRRQQQGQSTLLMNSSMLCMDSSERRAEGDGDNNGEGEGEDASESGAVFLSFPYRNREGENQSVPTDPWINYNDLDSTTGAKSHQNLASAKLRTRSELHPSDVDAWSEELEKRLLASPIIRDLDNFDLEDSDDLDEDEDGYSDEEDEDGYSSSGSSSDICESDEEFSDDGRLVNIDANMNETRGTGKDKGSLEEKTKVYGKVLMSFWEEEDDDDEVKGVDVEEAGVVDGEEEEEEWVEDVRRVVEVQVQA